MAQGWSKDKRTSVEQAFYEFLRSCYINSKDSGLICLGDNLYYGQILFITAVFDGLEAGKHKFYVLKSRQLGISTIVRALSIFYIGVHDGLQGALVLDTGENKESARSEIIDMLNNLPAKLKFPKIKSDNRQGLTLENQSKILFKSAGVRASKASGTLGRSFGLGMATLSELCSFDNDEGLEAFEQSLSEINPDRFYCYESTARGFNRWHEMWVEAKNDPDHCVCIFLGWWSKPSQSISKTDVDFLKYGTQPPTDKELKRIQEVKDRYDVQITPEQLAWVRRKMDPSAKSEGDAPIEFEGGVLRLQEQPWVEEDAFQFTGSVFFAPEKLTDQATDYVSNDYKTYMYGSGVEFVDLRVYKAPNNKSIELKVWEEPDPDGVYVIAADPAFGANENNDRSAIQVLRCYADCIEQVAEYAWPLINTRQFGWVIASLLGWYAGETAPVYLILELNGPGEAVWNELQSLKHQVTSGYQPKEVEEKGLRNVFRNVRNYIYARSDSMSPGYNYQFKCLSVDTRIPTPEGWTTMGQIKAGDALFDDKGNICTVTNATKEMSGHDCYQIEFDDGSKIIADDEHLWETYGGQIVKTVDLIPNKDFISVNEPLVLADKSLPIDPYVLGVWIGDGSSASGKVFAHKKDIGEISKHIIESGYSLGEIRPERKGNVCYRTIVGLTKTLTELGLIKNKHIPPQYLRASFEQRLSLLQGLMDTDGTITAYNGRQCSFTTTNPILAAQFSELVRTLGMKAKFLSRIPQLEYKGKMVTCAMYYQFRFTSYPELPVFKMKRKLDRTEYNGPTRKKRSRRHKIISVEKIDSVPVKCIRVDSPSHLYLAGDGMVPTHNTNSNLKISIMERLRDFMSNGMLHIRSMDTLEEMRSVTREGDAISAQGRKKDDRVMSLAMGVRCWEEKVRKSLATNKRTKENEVAKKRMTVRDQADMYQRYQLDAFFAVKRVTRYRELKYARRAAWRSR